MFIASRCFEPRGCENKRGGMRVEERERARSVVVCLYEETLLVVICVCKPGIPDVVGT